MTSIKQTALEAHRQLVDWYDRDDATDDELERIIAMARELIEQSDAAGHQETEFVLYDFDSDRLLSTEVYRSYADAAAEAAGLDDVLILRLPLPFKEPAVANATDGDSICDCELPGFFYCGVPGILAHLKGGRVAPRAKVERCDQCQRYESDEAAQQKLIELGIL